MRSIRSFGGFGHRKTPETISENPSSPKPGGTRREPVLHGEEGVEAPMVELHETLLR